jgi:hypothetical protein
MACHGFCGGGDVDEVVGSWDGDLLLDSDSAGGVSAEVDMVDHLRDDRFAPPLPPCLSKTWLSRSSQCLLTIRILFHDLEYPLKKDTHSIMETIHTVGRMSDS